MKKLIFLILYASTFAWPSLSLVAAAAPISNGPALAPGLTFSSQLTALMQVRKQSGFVPPDYAYSVKCEIGTNSVLKEKVVGTEKRSYSIESTPTVYTEKVKDADQAKALIAAAAKGKLIEESGPSDKPTATYVGIIEGSVIDKHVKIFIDNSTFVYKNSVESARGPLVEFADANCSVE